MFYAVICVKKCEKAVKCSIGADETKKYLINEIIV